MVIPLPPAERVFVVRVSRESFDDGLASGTATVDGRPLRWIAVDRGARGVVAYIDSCPHWSVSLLADDATRYDTDVIFCSRHGARFRLDDGLCDAGPCEGRALTALVVETAGDGLTLSMIRDRFAPRHM
jgi:nitrite reductase/ring-hydroxylating ferredoxin subunit